MAATRGSTIPITAEPRRTPTPAQQRSMAARRVARVGTCSASTLAPARDVRPTGGARTVPGSPRTAWAAIADSPEGATRAPIADSPEDVTPAPIVGDRKDATAEVVRTG